MQDPLIFLPYFEGNIAIFAYYFQNVYSQHFTYAFIDIKFLSVEQFRRGHKSIDMKRNIQ